VNLKLQNSHKFNSHTTYIHPGWHIQRVSSLVCGRQAEIPMITINRISVHNDLKELIVLIKRLVNQTIYKELYRIGVFM